MRQKSEALQINKIKLNYHTFGCHSAQFRITTEFWLDIHDTNKLFKNGQLRFAVDSK